MKIRIKITNSENASHYGVSVGSEVEEEFETYVAAVVASEIGNAPIEACKAQAVASRTYACRYILKEKTVSDSGASAQSFRIKRYSKAYQNCIDGTKATKGRILTYKGSPADTYFSHSNGGMTTSSNERWGGMRDYLVSKPDPWDAATGINKIGHGVGMSQTGAKYAAEHGIGYKNILSFYYPGTVLSPIPKKEELIGMITLDKFLEGCQKNAARIKGYKQPYSGQNGLSDCIGYIIGALELEGQKWGGTHGSNYAKRYRSKNFHAVTNASQLKLGDIVFKARKPGEAGYDLPEKYKTGSNPDLNDYYHVGVVTSVNPLVISHCSTGGMNYDKKLGKWKYAAECSLVNYGSRAEERPVAVETEAPGVTTGKLIVDVPDDTTVNVRAKASLTSNIVAKLPEGAAVNVTSTFGSWSHIEYENEKTGTGYVMSKFITADGLIDVPDDTSVNVRSKPSTNATKITTIPEGGKVKVIGKSGQWSKVEFSIVKSGTGYVMSKYLRKG